MCAVNRSSGLGQNEVCKNYVSHLQHRKLLESLASKTLGVLFKDFSAKPTTGRAIWANDAEA